MEYRGMCIRLSMAAVLFGLSGWSVPLAHAQKPAPLSVLQAFDHTALNAGALAAGHVRKREAPIRYRIDGQETEPLRIAYAHKIIAQVGGEIGLATSEVTDPDERENLHIHFSDVEYLVASDGTKTPCLYMRHDAAKSKGEVRHLRIDITLATNPQREASPDKFDLARCIYTGVFRAVGLISDPDSSASGMSIKNVKASEPSLLDWKLLRLLYHPQIQPGLSRLPALQRAWSILNEGSGAANTNETAMRQYLDKVVEQLTVAAGKGNRIAQEQLAEIYEAGLHVAPDAAKAEYYKERASLPGRVTPGSEIPLDDFRYLPFGSDGVPYAGYREFLDSKPPRAFALAPSNSWGRQGNRSNPQERALGWCQKFTETKCVLYAVDDKVVWRPQEHGPYADEAADWSVVPPPEAKPLNNSYGPTPNRHPAAQVVSTDELRAWLSTPEKPMLLDVSRSQSWSLPGSYHVDLGLAPTFPDRHLAAIKKMIGEVRGDKSRRIVLYCTSVYCWHAYNALLFLNTLGFENMYWYRGGISAWRAAGEDVQWPVRLELF